ncbi:MAG TPA: hypothetical protein PKD59_15895 [Miltoncostaeaceae bacterium]|nr:hypothetical protein [Miltoncostaeaceae bacterium]
MEPGDILRRSWELYRAHPRHLIGIAAVVFVPLGVVGGVLAGLGWPGVLAANLLGLAAIFFVQGALVKAVEDVRDGRVDLGIAGTFGHASGRLVALAGAGILALVGICIGLVLLIVPGLVLLTWWLVVSPVIMIEHRRVLESFGRSRELVQGSAWPVFTVAVLTLLIILVAGVVLALALSPINSDSWKTLIGQAVTNSLAAPFAAVAWTLTYFRLREIEEGE